MKTLLVKENLTNPINFQLKQSSSLSAYVKIWSFLMMMLFCRNVMGQAVNIATDGLNNSTTLFTLSGGAYYTGTTSSSADSPSSSAYATEGTHSRGVANGTATLTTTNNINVSSYTSIQLNFRLASYSVGSTGNGADATDIVTVEVSTDGGTTYYSTVRVLGNSNARWSWTSGTGNASTAYDGNATPVNFQSSAGIATTSGFSNVTITDIPASANLKIRITLFNDNGNERWLMDDFKLTGIAAVACSIPDVISNPSASNGSSQSILTWTNGSCYDQMMVVATNQSFSSALPTGDGTSYTANSTSFTDVLNSNFDNGVVLYNGSGTSTTITSLTNGTTYNFKIYTRKGTSWVASPSFSATPALAQFFWDADGNTTPATGGAGSWDLTTTNNWRTPNETGTLNTWAANSTPLDAVFSGISGTVTIPLTANTTLTAPNFYFNTNGYTLATTSTSSLTLSGPIILNNNIGLTFAPNVNTTIPASGTFNVRNISGTGTANLSISSALSTSAVAQRINLSAANSSISVPINIISAGGIGTNSVAGIVGTATGTSLSSAATITNNSSVKTIIGATSGFDITANGVISGTADLMFAAGASGGAGTVTLNAANTYSGATILNAANSGIVKLGIDNALPVTTNLTFAYSSGNGGSLDLNGKNQTLAAIINGGFGSGVNKIFNNGNTDATLTINGSTSPTAFVFGLQDGSTNKLLLTKSGSGKLILDGSTTTGGNTYTGLTTVNEGILQLSKAGGNTIPVGNSVTINGGTLQISSNQTLETITLNGGTIQVDNGVTLTINNLTIPNGATLKLVGTGKISGSGTFILSSGATLISEQSISLAVLNYVTKSFSSSANYVFKGISIGTFATTPTTNTVNDLTIESGAGTTIMNQAFNINGTLTLISGTLDIGANTLTIGGSVSQTSGNIDADAGTVSFTNSTALSLPTSLFSGNIYNLSKESGAGAVTLNDNLTVTNELNSAASTGAFIIASSKELTISGTCKATINGTITNNGSFTLNSGATLLQGSSSSITNGTYNVKQTITGSGGATPNGRFWYLGSPLSNGSSTALLSSTGNQLWQWDETNVNYSTMSTGLSLSQGKSYVLRSGQTAETISFSGTGLTNGALYILNLSRTGTSAQMRGCHLVSNPYPSYLDWDLVGKTNVSTTMYVRTALGSNFNVLETYNSFDQIGTSLSGTPMTKDIAPMQGFWVKVTTDGQTGSLALDNGMRSHQTNGAGLRSSAQNFPAFLRMNVLDGENKDQVILFMSPDATSALDAHDSEKLPVTGFAQIYSIVDAKKLVINGMKNVKSKTSIPLTLDLPSSKSYTFQAEEFNIEDGLILLEDKQEGLIQDLTINPVYSFFGNAGTNNTRFVIHFQLAHAPVLVGGPAELEILGTDELTTENIHIVSNNQGLIEVRLEEGFNPDGIINIFDASGRIVAHQSFNNQVELIELGEQNGIYFVEVSAGKVISKKKIVILH